MSTKVFKYYCEPKSREDEALMREHLVLGARYRLRLQELENAKRAEERALEDEDPVVASRRTRVARWYGYVDNIDESRRAEIARNALDCYRKSLNSALKHRWEDEDYKGRLRHIRENFNEQKKIARKTSGLSFGNYQFLEEAHDQAQRTSQTRFADVRTRVEFDEGVIAVHVHQRGPKTESSKSGTPMLLSQILDGDDTFVRLGSERYARSEFNRSGQRRAQRFQHLQIRVASDGRSPVWCNFNVILHRPLPSDATVTWVRVHRERCGLRYRYSCQFVLSSEDATKAPVAESVGVDLGWRYTDSGRRIAYAVGTDGKTHELLIPKSVMDRRAKTEDLRSIRDRHLDELRAEWIAHRTSGSAGEWFVEATRAIHLTRKPRTFAKITREWGSRLADGDVDLHARSVVAMKRDRHLLAWEANNDRRMRLQIKSRVAWFCAMLAEHYGSVYFEKLSAQQLLSDDRGDGTVEDKKNRRRHRQTVAVVGPFQVLEQLQAAFKKRARDASNVNAKDTSRKCLNCPNIMPRSSDVALSCENCGSSYDRDFLGASNILAKGRAQRSSLGPLDAAITKTSAPRKLRPRTTRRRNKSLLENTIVGTVVAQ